MRLRSGRSRRATCADGRHAGDSCFRGRPVVRRTVEEAPNVVTEEGFRDLLQRGYHVEVVALEDAHKRHNVWYGLWTVRAVSPDSRDERLLVISRASLKTRVFKTANGLISFLYELGCPSANVLRYEGARASHYPQGCRPRSD